MGLSRLDNFLKSAKGEILYVDPSALDSTDSIENKGNSLARPFKTIQRALIEAARFSYQSGPNNDRFGRTTILLYPGEHIVDNRPGWIPIHDQVANTYRLRSGTTSDVFPPFDINSNFDLDSASNALYKLNSIHGGVIIPRGTSLVGLDLRKTKIIPRYVPDPENDQIERSAIFRLTGACYMWQFSIFDGDQTGSVYKDYTTNAFVPNFSHHKLTAFEYADGVNPVSINDDFLVYEDTDTDLDMYYQKVGFAYGTPSGRDVSPDYPLDNLDIEPKIDEYRIVGSTGTEVGITSIKAGDGIISSNVITVDLAESTEGLDVDTPIKIEGIADTGYDGKFAILESISKTQIKYQVSTPPVNPLPATTSGATLSVSVDTVTSASPYIFNISLRSVFGMCGLHADGNKASGFKSMVLAQFTGIGLQKDDNAFVKYNTSSGLYEGRLAAGNENIHTDSLARYKPDYENFHIKASNNALLQIVSVFAIGFANHFLLESGGDASITNSNSNFGARALVSKGFRPDAFARDDLGYISHIVTPKEIESSEGGIEFLGIDVGVTTSVGIATTSKLYLYDEKNQDIPPTTVIDGYRIGAKDGEVLKVLLSEGNEIETYHSRVIMPNTEGTSNEVTKEKRHKVARVNDINSISSNTITFENSHTFLNGESVRVFSEDGSLPDGIETNTVYYAITTAISPNPALSANQIKLATTINDANNDIPITINNSGGVLTVVSRVSDKAAGDLGHPVQYDQTNGQWYINVSTAGTETSIYNQLWTRGVTELGEVTPRTFVLRKPRDRSIEDSTYKLRYVLPKDSTIFARPPVDGFVLQESNNVDGANDAEIEKFLSFDSQTLNNSTEFRNFKFIANAEWDSTTEKATYRTELPHHLTEGSHVEITNIVSGLNTTGAAKKGFNGEFFVDSIDNRKEFKISMSSNPGDFTSDTSVRDSNLPKLKKKKHEGVYFVYKSQEIRPFIQNEQDGVYHVTVLNSSNSPTVSPFTGFRLPQPIGNLYPEYDRDNPISDPEEARSHATRDLIGRVVVNDPEKSITKETAISSLFDNGVGFGITDIKSDQSTDATTHTIFTDNDHGFNRLIEAEIVDGGIQYGSGAGTTESLFNAQLVGFAGSVTGSHATAAVKVSAAGTLTDIKIIDGGSAYGVGNTLSVVGIATSGVEGFVPGYVRVTKVYDNVGDSISVFRIVNNHTDYNTSYRISNVSVGETASFDVTSATSVGIGSTQNGIGAESTALAYGILNGQSFSVLSADYTFATGIATFTLDKSHGLQVNDKFIFGGATGVSTIFNGEHLITKVDSSNLDQLTANVGVGTTTVLIGGSPAIYPKVLTSKGGEISVENENISSRLSYQYGNVTASLASAMTKVATTLEITDLDNYDLRIGDFLLIGHEIVRIRSTVTGNPITVFRGVLGTEAKEHAINTVVRRIIAKPVELRRHSIIRASGHTFEYLGYGPGNYSTAFPDRQDRELSAEEEVLSQSFSDEGGFIVYTGMNSDGDFYVSNKRVITTANEEETFNTPQQRFRGETKAVPKTKLGFNVISASEVNVTDAIRIEGGDSKTTVSYFDGPLILNNKLTVTSNKGVETTDIFLQGKETVSRKYTVGISNPPASVELTNANAGNPGDIIFNGNPSKGNNAGWVYTTDNEWYPWGLISTDNDKFTIEGNFIGTFTGDGSALTNVSDIWAIDATGIHTTRNVGFGSTTSSKADVAMYVQGNAEIRGTMKVFEIIENTTLDSTTIIGSGVTTIDLDLDTSSIYYYTQDAGSNWSVNLRANVGTALTDFLEIGESITVAVTTKQGPTAYYNNDVYIDNILIAPRYYGSLTINSGNANSLDLYTYVVVRKDNTGSPVADFDVLYSQSQYQ
jgi:hypothetical protein